MGEDLIESPQFKDESEIKIKKTIVGLKEVTDPPRPPDFIAEDHNACAWVSQRNSSGEPIKLNVKVGSFYFKLRKRFL